MPLEPKWVMSSNLSRRKAYFIDIMVYYRKFSWDLLFFWNLIKRESKDFCISLYVFLRCGDLVSLSFNLCHTTQFDTLLIWKKKFSKKNFFFEIFKIFFSSNLAELCSDQVIFKRQKKFFLKKKILWSCFFFENCNKIDKNR